MKYYSYKGRSIDPSLPVQVYKNLHNGLWSVKQGGLVVAHVESITLHNVGFKAGKAGRERVLREKAKNVHAFITGMVVSVNDERPDNLSDVAISYNPYKADYFYTKHDGKPAELEPEQMVYCNVNTGINLI